MYDEDMPAFDPEPLDEDEINPDEGDDYDLAYDLMVEERFNAPQAPIATKSEYEIGIVKRSGEIEKQVVVLALTADEAFAAARLLLSRPAASLVLIDTRPL